MVETSESSTSDDALGLVAFWRDAGAKRWFKPDVEFDRRFRETYLALHEGAARGDLGGWLATADGALALVLLLDQFPRNAFRGTRRVYETDALAVDVAEAAIARGHDRAAEAPLQVFFYLPFMHSERLPDQEKSLALVRRIGEHNLKYAIGHHDIIRRFGRFPHRNAILGRATTADEQRFLDEGGFGG
jgi:uncharacterized protein (DUF924 family)